MMGVSMPKRTASSSKKGHQPDSYGSLTGTGSRPKAVGSPVVKPTSMGGTLEKIEMGMTGIYSGCRPATCFREEPQSTAHMNTTLGQSHVNLPSRTMTWRTPKTKLHMTTHAPDKGGRSNPNEVVERPYCHFTVNTTSKLKLRTKNASASSYYGVMFSVTALRRPIRITQLHMASGAWRRELYRVYMKQGGISNQMVDPLQWGEVAAGETELPALTKGIYGAVPFPYDGIKIQPGCTVSIYVHSPYHQHGVAFRRFAKSWPGYPSFDASTDKNDDISIGVARATYSQTPFERLSQEGYAFAGLVEYSPCEEEKNMLRSSPRRADSLAQTTQRTDPRSPQKEGSVQQGSGREGKLLFYVYSLECKMGACMSVDESRDHLINLQGWPKDAPPLTFSEADLEWESEEKKAEAASRAWEVSETWVGNDEEQKNELEGEESEGSVRALADDSDDEAGDGREYLDLANFPVPDEPSSDEEGGGEEGGKEGSEEMSEEGGEEESEDSEEDVSLAQRKRKVARV